MYAIARNITAYVAKVAEHAAVRETYYNGKWMVQYKGHWFTKEEYEGQRVKPESLLEYGAAKGETIGSTLIRTESCAINH